MTKVLAKTDRQRRSLAASSGVVFRSARVLSGRTQQEIADEIGVSRITMTNLESGRHPPTLDTFVALCMSFGMAPHAVLRSLIEGQRGRRGGA